MASHSEGGWLTSKCGHYAINSYTTKETLSCGIVRTTHRKEMKTGCRWYVGVISLGLTELSGVSSDYFTYTYAYKDIELGHNENDAADKSYEIGCDYFKQGKYEDAIQWLDIAYQTCKSGYSRNSLFRYKRDTAEERLVEKQREEARQERDQQDKQKQQEIERKAQRHKVMKQWQRTKLRAVCQEDARKKCEDRALYRRDKHTVLICSAVAYQKQSQMEVNAMPDSIQFTEVPADSGEKAELNYDEEDASEAVEGDVAFEVSEFKGINAIDLQVEQLLDCVLQNNGSDITRFQVQMFFMSIYRILDAVDTSVIDLERMLESICNMVRTNNMSIHDFLSVATLVTSSSRLQQLICESSAPTSLLNELKSTWLHQMLAMKSIEHSESDLNKFLNVATKFNFNFFVIATQKVLRFYIKFTDLLNFFVKIQKCPLTNESKQHFIQALPVGSSPLNLLAESLIRGYFAQKFINFQGWPNRPNQTIEFDPSSLSNFKAVVLKTKAEHEHVLELAEIIHNQFTAHWNLSYVDELLGLIDKTNKILPMATCLLHFHEFQGSPPLLAFEELLSILQNIPAGKWINEVHGALVERAFREKDCSFKPKLGKLKHFDCDELHTYLKSVNLTSLRNHLINNLHKNENDINIWSQTVRGDASPSALYEIIAVVNRAVQLHSGHLPREVQNLALLLLLEKKDNNTGGRLLQVNTGEGKTLIVAMFAAIMALRGHRIDVITSSPELAKPQCQKMSSFYAYFGLSAAYITPDCADNIRKKAYKADIVYGAAQDFQGDILRDEYSQLGTRNGRKCDTAIVDEVDSMLIDGRNHLVMLSSPVPGMENLEPVLATIWNHISMIESQLFEKNGRVYLVDGCNRINEDGSLKPDQECIGNASPIKQTKLEFIKEHAEHFMRLLLRDDEHLDNESKEMCKNLPEMFVPHHLREFVLNVQLPNWINSAIFARYGYKTNQHYIIKNSNIFPVDASNTGTIQVNLHISDGIHQFLQIKHGAKISSETYATNYMSNVAFFKRYGSRLVGLTGTLGSDSEHRLLKRLYDVDTAILPPFRMKQYRQLRPLSVYSKDEWLLTIAKSCMRKLEIGRAVLVIVQYLSEVDLLQKFLIARGLKESKIQVYKTEEHSGVTQHELRSGEIVIATNIAGRGTDISVSKEVEEHGGLHVCLTFLPVNERVEVQNFGRTSRTGNRGTGQFIVFCDVDSTLVEMKRARNEIETNRLLEAETEIQKVLIKDGIFVEFCTLLKNVRSKFRTKSRLECEYNVRAVEERFGLWLKENEDKIESETDFQPFCALIKQELELDTFIRNPYFHILKGNLKMDQKCYDLAIEEYTRALQLDDRFLSNAYYNRGYCKLIVYSQGYKKEMANEAIEDFKKAKEIIEGRLERDLFVIQQSAPASEALSEQVNHMLTLFSMQKSAIECAIGKGKGYVKEEIARLNKPDNKGNADEIEKYIKQLKENQVRYEEGVIGEALQNGNRVEVILSSIESSLPAEEKLSLYECEIDTFRNNGNLGSFNVKLIKPIDWGSVISLALIGLGQMVTGAAIAVFSVGAGATIGLSMLIEGVTDLITCVVDGMINRDFNWSAWSAQKVVSYAVSIACAGLSALKNAAKVAYEGVKQTVRTVTKGLTTVAKTGWKFAAKKAGQELSKGVARKLIYVVANYSLNCTIMPLVETKIRNVVQQHVRKMVDTNEDVAILLEIDRTNRNAHHQQQIIQSAMAILYPKSEPSNVVLGLVRALQQIGQGVLSNKIEGLSQAIMLVNIESVLLELFTYFPEFVSALKGEILSIANKHRELEDKQEKTMGSKPTVPEEQAKLEAIQSAHGNLTEQLSQAVTSSMCNIIEGNLMSPLLGSVVYQGVNSLNAEINRSLSESIEVYKSQRRLIMLQDGDQCGMIDKKCKQGTRDKEAAAKARHIIDNLENGGEAGLPILGSVSDTINRPVTILDSSGNVMMYLGDDKPGEPVYLKYHEPTELRSGHWTGPNSTELAMAGTSSNNCLFDTVADQLQMDPDQLRNSVCNTLKTDKHLNLLASGVRDIVHLQNLKEKYLLYGGFIRYLPNAGKVFAFKIIAGSQGCYSQGKRAKNHPYGHVLGSNSGKERRKDIDCLENYSVGEAGPRFFKSGVMSKESQAELTDYVLSSPEGQQAIKIMNDPKQPDKERLEQRIRIKIPKSLKHLMTSWDNNGERSLSRGGVKFPCQVDEYEVRICRPKEEKDRPNDPFPPDIFTAFPWEPKAPDTANPPT